jgi:hypothetical protein
MPPRAALRGQSAQALAVGQDAPAQASQCGAPRARLGAAAGRAPAQVKMSTTSSMRQNARAASETPMKHEHAMDAGLCSSAER